MYLLKYVFLKIKLLRKIKKLIEIVSHLKNLFLAKNKKQNYEL